MFDVLGWEIPEWVWFLGAVRGCGMRSRIGSGSYLSDTLAVLATVQDGPGNATGVLALEEEGLGFAVLEPEDLGVATDVELTLQQSQCQRFCSFAQCSSFPSALRGPLLSPVVATAKSCPGGRDTAAFESFVPALAVSEGPLAIPPIVLGEEFIVPFQGRSSGPRMCRRRSSS